MSSRKSRYCVSGTLLAVSWVLGPAVACAQSGDSESGEIAGFAGAAFGAGGQPVVGGSAGISFSRYGMALFETSFMTLGTHTIQNWPSRSAVRRSVLWDFSLDFHVRIPVRSRWEPYAIVGTAFLWNQVRANAVDLRGVARVNYYDQFNGAFNTGGGVRYFIGNGWGIRPQVKVVVSKQVYTQVSIGIFYVTPPDWP